MKSHKYVNKAFFIWSLAEHPEKKPKVIILIFLGFDV